MTTPPHVTLAAVAAAAGVSLATVSKVLNSRADVAADTRTRVMETMHELGYQRRRRRSSSGLIEVVFPVLSIEYSLEILRGIEAVATTEGWSVVVTEAGNRHTLGDDWFAAMLKRNPVGVILVFAGLDDTMRRQLAERSISAVVLDPAGDPAADMPSVGATNWAGGVEAAQHLIAQGHTDIAVVSGPAELMCSHARVNGYRSAMEVAGLPVRDEWVCYGNFDVSGGREHAAALLDGPNPPTAIFAGSDLQAIGVMERARERALRLPEDLSVVGFDDIPIAQYVTPGLTTIRQPIRDMAYQAAKLVASPEEWAAQVPRLELATTLVERGSTAPPRGR